MGVGAAGVVDEDVELVVGEGGDLVVAGLDAGGARDVEGEGGHAQGAEVGEDGWVAGCGYDVQAWGEG